jgi:hypothetical protein
MDPLHCKRPARLFVSSVWLTTADVAKALEVTRHGVRYLVRAGELRPVVTPATGQWLFGRAEVDAVVQARARRRLRAVDEVRRAFRLVARQAEPRQLALPLYGRPGRKVTTRPRSEPPVERPDVWPGRITTVTGTAADRRRMAKADLHERPTYAVTSRRR